MTTILRRAVLPLAVMLVIVLSATPLGNAESPAVPASNSSSSAQQPGAQASLWVNITGATVMRAGGYCEWFAQAERAVARWIWKVDGVVWQDGTLAMFLYGGVSRSFTLTLTGIANDGTTGTDYHSVIVSPTASLCCWLSPGPACPVSTAPNAKNGALSRTTARHE